MTRAVLALPLVLSLGACAAVGPNFARPAGPAAETYAMAGDARASGLRLTDQAREAAGWWRALGSARLDAVMLQAVATSPTLAEADAVLRAAEAQVQAAEAALGPQATLSGGAKRERFNTSSFGFAGFPSPTINLYSVGGAVNYDLDLFGGGKRQAESVRARAQAQAARAQAAYLTLTGNIALQAMRIASLNADLAALDVVIAEDRRTIEMIARAESAGGAAASDLTVGRAELARDEAQRPAIERDLAAARHQLALLVGKAPADWSAPAFVQGEFTRPTDLPVALPSALLRQRPDIAAAEAELHAATADIGVATAALYPNIRLTASLTQTTPHAENLFRYDSSGWNIAGGLTAPLFNGGRLRAGKRAAEAQAKAALARYNGAVLRAFVQVSDAMAALAEDDKAIAALARVRDAQAGKLKDARAAYELGAGTLLAVADGQRGLSRAERELARAQGRRDEDLVALLVATAGAPLPR